MLVYRVSGGKIVEDLESVYSKLKAILEKAKKSEDIDEESVNKIVNLVNEIVRIADHIADVVIGFLESEEF